MTRAWNAETYGREVVECTGSVTFDGDSFACLWCDWSWDFPDVIYVIREEERSDLHGKKLRPGRPRGSRTVMSRYEKPEPLPEDTVFEWENISL